MLYMLYAYNFITLCTINKAVIKNYIHLCIIFNIYYNKLNKKNMIIIKTTVKRANVKNKIIKTLINNKYAACINVISDVSSFYEWKKKIVKNKEYVLLIKTNLNNEDIVYKTIKGIHDYEVPEIITIKISNVSKGYLNWLNKNIIKEIS